MNEMKSMGETALPEHDQRGLDQKLVAAAIGGDAAGVAMLLSAGASAEMIDDMGRNAFEHAVRGQCLEAMELLAGKSDVNRRSINGWTPLAESILMRRSEAVVAFLASVSDLSLKNRPPGKDFMDLEDFSLECGSPEAADVVAHERGRRAAGAERAQIASEVACPAGNLEAQKKRPRI